MGTLLIYVNVKQARLKQYKHQFKRNYQSEPYQFYHLSYGNPKCFSPQDISHNMLCRTADLKVGGLCSRSVDISEREYGICTFLLYDLLYVFIALIHNKIYD